MSSSSKGQPPTADVVMMPVATSLSKGDTMEQLQWEMAVVATTPSSATAAPAAPLASSSTTAGAASKSRSSATVPVAQEEARIAPPTTPSAAHQAGVRFPIL